MMETEQFILHENDWLPNNERLPVLLYRGVVNAEGKKAAERFERMFADHGWPPQWRDTIFDYDHYHSTAHEALGVATGYGTLLLGGPGGREVEVRAGDALILPVGVGHRRVEASAISWSLGRIRGITIGTYAERRPMTRRAGECGRSRSLMKIQSPGAADRFASAGSRTGEASTKATSDFNLQVGSYLRPREFDRAGRLRNERPRPCPFIR